MTFSLPITILYVLLVVGFGFVIFWHELGHFLAAKWAGVKVEQFAVGFGHAMVCWRKGLGFTVGTSAEKFKARIVQKWNEEARSNANFQEKTAADLTPEIEQRLAAELGISETEYRLNWMPLGGYVKMLGQDDMNPNATAVDPRAFNMKPIGKRMVIVSAGVVMNIILAAIGFCLLFRVGFTAPPAVVGGFAPGSPAQRSGLHIGDRIVEFDGKHMHDFTKIQLSVALVEAGTSVPMKVQRAGTGAIEELQIKPEPMANDVGLLFVGLEPASLLRGWDSKKVPDNAETRDAIAKSWLKPDDTVIKANGQPLNPDTDEYKLDAIIQSSAGHTITLTIRDKAGKEREEIVKTAFVPPFKREALAFAGMQPRATVDDVRAGSPAMGVLRTDDIITGITDTKTNDSPSNPTLAQLPDLLNRAGKNGSKVIAHVLRDGKPLDLAPVSPTMKLGDGRVGLGVLLGYDEEHAVLADVAKDSPAEHAGVPRGSTIVSIDGQPVKSWYDVQRIFAGTSVDKPLAVRVSTADSGEKTFDLKLSKDDVASVASYRYDLASALPFESASETRRTNNTLQAAWWGVQETRDTVVQFYIQLRRMFEGSISPKNAMGPIGIVGAGAKMAERGGDWVLWFLAMISANLAVVNFLPIPIVDGGLFLFLILEKIQGKPLSARAQSIAQFAGLALILSVFVFVTFHDITRMFS